MTAEQFFQGHGVSCVEELSHAELLEFAQECMDVYSSISVRTLLSGSFGVPPDPMPEETDAGIIEAHKKGLSFIANYIERESCNGPQEKDVHCGPYEISVQDRSEYLNDLKQI